MKWIKIILIGLLSLTGIGVATHIAKKRKRHC